MVNSQQYNVFKYTTYTNRNSDSEEEDTEAVCAFIHKEEGEKERSSSEIENQ